MRHTMRTPMEPDMQLSIRTLQLKFFQDLLGSKQIFRAMRRRAKRAYIKLLESEAAEAVKNAWIDLLESEAAEAIKNACIDLLESEAAEAIKKAWIDLLESEAAEAIKKACTKLLESEAAEAAKKAYARLLKSEPGKKAYIKLLESEVAQKTLTKLLESEPGKKALAKFLESQAADIRPSRPISAVFQAQYKEMQEDLPSPKAVPMRSTRMLPVPKITVSTSGQYERSPRFADASGLGQGGIMHAQKKVQQITSTSYAYPAEGPPITPPPRVQCDPLRPWRNKPLPPVPEEPSGVVLPVLRQPIAQRPNRHALLGGPFPTVNVQHPSRLIPGQMPGSVATGDASPRARLPRNDSPATLAGIESGSQPTPRTAYRP